jgi:hypothetical protein
VFESAVEEDSVEKPLHVDIEFEHCPGFGRIRERTDADEMYDRYKNDPQCRSLEGMKRCWLTDPDTDQAIRGTPPHWWSPGMAPTYGA